ncbi:hypothetical protein [Aurantimonas sp. NFXS3]|uniref:hypothetical protein n=1 Tax=Aurantimonas sp. NFXS3 TaxID=2818434 RepID=UPI003B8D6AB9
MNVTSTSTEIPGLHASLKPYVSKTRFGLNISSPLVQILHLELAAREAGLSMAELANRLLKDKEDSLLLAKAQGDWENYVCLHERAYRVDALVSVIEQHSSKGGTHPELSIQLGEIASEVWYDAKYPWQSLEDWRFVFQTLDANKQSLMSKSERRALRKMPSEFTVYRGVSAVDHMEAEEAAFGLSWTTQQSKAEWFARRFALDDSQAFVIEATISKKAVIAYLTGREESEILIDPDNIYEMKIEELEREMVEAA